MRIPGYIQDKMHIAANLHARAASLIAEVDEYLQKKNVSPDIYRCGNGISLEEIEYGNDVTDQFVRWADYDFPTDFEEAIWR